jgi:hypothetical protein
MSSIKNLTPPTKESSFEEKNIDSILSKESRPFYDAVFALSSFQQHAIHCMLKTALILAFLMTGIIASADSSWTIPVGGNAYVTKSSLNCQDGIVSGVTQFTETTTVFSVYFHVDRACQIKVSAKVLPSKNDSYLKLTHDQKNWSIPEKKLASIDHNWEKIDVAQAGYIRIDLQALSSPKGEFPRVSDLLVRSATKDLSLNYVKNNDGNMFYWGRRGPSVHLGYEMPSDKKIHYSYSEVTVHPGDDASGSFYMANGFSEGYFGMQVKSSTERWIIFSVWSPFQTDDPKSVPAEDRVVLLAKGNDVYAGEFGNEGSGGKSYKIYPWQSGITYRFLNSAKPDGNGNTIYSAWFAELGKENWELIARFQRPKTSQHITGFYSFLENFIDDEGFLERSSVHGNQWVCDTDGQWHELTKARFTCDATGTGGHRLDFAGGTNEQGFFLRNCGFFNKQVKPNQWFQRKSTPDKKPSIAFTKLP